MRHTEVDDDGVGRDAGVLEVERFGRATVLCGQLVELRHLGPVVAAVHIHTMTTHSHCRAVGSERFAQLLIWD